MLNFWQIFFFFTFLHTVRTATVAAGSQEKCNYNRSQWNVCVDYTKKTINMTAHKLHTAYCREEGVLNLCVCVCVFGKV